MITLAFGAPTDLLSANKKLHWAASGRIRAAWREAAHWSVIRRSDKADLRCLPPCIVQVDFPVQTNRRRDPHNYTSTLVKPIIDGLVDAGLWPDDTPEWVTVADPSFTAAGTSVKVNLTPRETET